MKNKDAREHSIHPLIPRRSAVIGHSPQPSTGGITPEIGPHRSLGPSQLVPGGAWSLVEVGLEGPPAADVACSAVERASERQEVAEGDLHDAWGDTQRKGRGRKGEEGAQRGRSGASQ